MKQLKSVISNVLKVILLFASFVVVIGMLTFVLGESSYGIKNKIIADMCAMIANTLADWLIFVLAGLFVAVYFRREYKLRNRVSWKRILLITILAVISSFGLYSFGPFFIFAALILILCIVIWKYMRRFINNKKKD